MMSNMLAFILALINGIAELFSDTSSPFFYLFSIIFLLFILRFMSKLMRL